VKSATGETKRIVVGVADMQLSSDPDALIVTHALGSCLGVALYDSLARVGGVLHLMLPDSSVSPAKAGTNPFMFVDTAMPRFLAAAIEAGASRERIDVRVAGGSAVRRETDFFAIGRRNLTALRKWLWKEQLVMSASDTGGHLSRTLYLELRTGRTWIVSAGKQWDL